MKFALLMRVRCGRRGIEQSFYKMYLFFDIECASVNKYTAKICAFGYCLTDEDFNVIQKEDILINPHGGFHLTDRKGEKGLVLPYDYAEFKDCPDFPAVAEKIYALLEDKNTLVCGHATGNDVKYLNLETKRFSLRSFAFDFADSQYVYMCLKGDMKRQYSLGAIAEELGVEFTPHRAADDAYATMKTAEAMSRAAGISFRELIKKCDITLGRIENYEITSVSSRAGRRAKAESRQKRERREKAMAEFHRFADVSARKRNKSGVWKDVRACFSRRVEEDGEIAFPLLRELLAAGAKYVYKSAECNLYVCPADENGLRRAAAENAGAKIATAEECFAALKNAAARAADGGTDSRSADKG